MPNNNRLSIYIIYAINITIIGVLFWRIKIINDDKAPLLMVVFYPCLIILNLICAGVFSLFGSDNYKSFLSAAKILLIMLLPITYIAFEI